jgi:hypothetical protein
MKDALAAQADCAPLRWSGGGGGGGFGAAGGGGPAAPASGVAPGTQPQPALQQQQQQQPRVSSPPQLTASPSRLSVQQAPAMWRPTQGRAAIPAVPLPLPGMNRGPSKQAFKLRPREERDASASPTPSLPAWRAPTRPDGALDPAFSRKLGPQHGWSPERLVMLSLSMSGSAAPRGGRGVLHTHLSLAGAGGGDR